MAEKILEIDHLTKRFGSLVALNNVSFSVNKGEVVGLIGPNGAGKTTLFNTACGFYRCTSGTIKYKGKDITKFSPDKLTKLGMVRTFQIPKPFKELTVYENVAVGTLFLPPEKKNNVENIKSEVERILDNVNLLPLENVLSGILSYGNLKNLELGRAQGPKPDLLLLDEPFAGLSPSEISNNSRIIKNLVDEGLTIIIVEHKLRELMKLVNRVIVLYYGEKIADGRPEEISSNEQVLKAYLGKRWSNDARKWSKDARN